jgi:hypothetical protein
MIYWSGLILKNDHKVLILFVIIMDEKRQIAQLTRS